MFVGDMTCISGSPRTSKQYLCSTMNNTWNKLSYLKLDVIIMNFRTFRMLTLEHFLMLTLEHFRMLTLEHFLMLTLEHF